jgi:hypothetical protein
MYRFPFSDTHLPIMYSLRAIARPRAVRGYGRWVGPLPAVGLRRETPRAPKGGGGETMSPGHRTHTS